jgi:hypothetical protein
MPLEQDWNSEIALAFGRKDSDDHEALIQAPLSTVKDVVPDVPMCESPSYQVGSFIL